MFKSIRTRFIAATLVGALTLVGCDKEDKAEAPSAAGVLTSEASILQYVPADSPYVLASVEPLPESVMDKLEPKLDKVLASYEGFLQATMKAIESEAETKVGSEEDAAKLSAVFGELSSLMSVEGMREAGFDRDSTAVFYGVGLLPVLRVSVTDGALFDAAMSRIEEKAGEKMSVAKIGNSAFRYADADDVKIIIATFKTQVVATLVPQSFTDDQISDVLGLTLPAENIAEAGVLADIASEYGYTGNFIGLIDVQKIVNTFAGDASGTDAALLELMQNDSPELSDVCKAEIREFGGIAPRMVTGYKSITADQAETQFVIEMRDDLASGLATLPAAVPGLGGDQGGLMSFGVSMDVQAARDFYEARLDAIESDPWECPQFAAMQMGIEGGRQALQQPVPPMVYDFKGFLAVIESLEGMDLANSMPPSSVDGRMLLAMDNAPALLAMGAMMSPELAGMNIEPNGEPVPFNLPQMAMIASSVFVALQDNGLAMSFGDGMEGGLSDMLNADAEESGTFMSFSMDAGRYYSFLADVMTLAEQDEENEMPPEMQAAMNDVMQAAGGLYDRMSADFRFTDRGIEMDTTVTFQD